MTKRNLPKIMGIINVTPDSFSDGGLYETAQNAIEHGWRLIEEGADVLDIGGESTRPGAQPVPVDEEIKRVVPVIEALKDAPAILSIDTRHAETMQAALAAGAVMVNDVTALEGDKDSLKAAAKADYVCLMHMQGQPQTMQASPDYDDVVEDVYAYLQQRIDVCEAGGIAKDRLIVDPGIGFGKTLAHNLALLKHLPRFGDLGCDVMLGASRKSFIGKVTGVENAADRMPGSIAAACWGAGAGIGYVRVHDVADTRQAMQVYQAILDSA